MAFCIGFGLMKHPCNIFTHYETLLLNMEYFATREKSYYEVILVNMK